MSFTCLVFFFFKQKTAYEMRISDWSSDVCSSDLRTLVNSTSTGLSKVNFPGNDDSERPGWDGEIEADEATPWVPKGRSGWEFGVNHDRKSVVSGKRVSVRVDLGGRRIIKKQLKVENSGRIVQMKDEREKKK